MRNRTFLSGNYNKKKLSSFSFHNNLPLRLTEKADTIDLSQIPSVQGGPRAPSIDRLDAYGDYDYINVDQHPKPIQYHKPLQHRPVNHQFSRPPQAAPSRRVEYQVFFKNVQYEPRNMAEIDVEHISRFILYLVE